MGLLRDLGVLAGILPIIKPDFSKLESHDKTNLQKLEELNGKNVCVNDFHHGVKYGTLRYVSSSHKYYIKEILPPRNELPYFVDDLKFICLDTRP